MRSKSTCISQEDFPYNEIWTRRSNPKGTDVKYPKWELVLGAPDILYFITYKAYMYRACFVKNLDQNIYYYCSNIYKSSVQDQLGTP